MTEDAMVEAWPADAKFRLGDFVAKKGRASWRGYVRGWYRTDLTALGYAVESAYEPGSVQIYPESALVAAEARQYGDGGRDSLRGKVGEILAMSLDIEPTDNASEQAIERIVDLLASPALSDTTADSDDGPIADAARNIASFTEGAARALVYARAKQILLEMLTNASRTFPLSRQRVDEKTLARAIREKSRFPSGQPRISEETALEIARPPSKEPIMDELEPCPWCRKPPKTCPDNSYGAALVFCPDANECEVSPMVEADLNAGETLDDAIRRWNSWNTRPAPSPADAGLVERLRASLPEVVEADERLSQAMLDNTSCEEAGAPDGLLAYRTMVLCAYNDLRIVLGFVDKSRKAIPHLLACIEALSGEYERGVEDAAKVADEVAAKHQTVETWWGRLARAKHKAALDAARSIAAAIRTLKAGGGDDQK